MMKGKEKQKERECGGVCLQDISKRKSISSSTFNSTKVPLVFQFQLMTNILQDYCSPRN